MQDQKMQDLKMQDQMSRGEKDAVEPCTHAPLSAQRIYKCERTPDPLVAEGNRLSHEFCFIEILSNFQIKNSVRLKAPRIGRSP